MQKNHYTSDQLFHFVGRASPDDDAANFETLLLVLNSGNISHRPHLPNGGMISFTVSMEGHLATENLLVPTVTCYCDIPEQHLFIHMKKYGRFGISFSRAYLIREGARPVTYVPMSATGHDGIHEQQMLEAWEATYRGMKKLTARSNGVRSRGFKSEPNTNEELLNALRTLVEKDFLAFVKPFNSDLADDDANNYYMEREWRKYGYLAATPETISGIWMPEQYIETFCKRMPQFATLAKICSPRS